MLIAISVRLFTVHFLTSIGLSPWDQIFSKLSVLNFHYLLMLTGRVCSWTITSLPRESGRTLAPCHPLADTIYCGPLWIDVTVCAVTSSSGIGRATCWLTGPLADPADRFFFWRGEGASFVGGGLTYKFLHGFRPLYFEIAEFWHLFLFYVKFWSLFSRFGGQTGHLMPLGRIMALNAPPPRGSATGGDGGDASPQFWECGG